MVMVRAIATNENSMLGTMLTPPRLTRDEILVYFFALHEALVVRHVYHVHVCIKLSVLAARAHLHVLPIHTIPHTFEPPCVLQVYLVADDLLYSARRKSYLEIHHVECIPNLAIL